MLGIMLSATPVSADDLALEQAELVPAVIHVVQSGGFWSTGDDEGYFRAVIISGGVEHVSHQLFIQWMRSNSESQDYELARTAKVEELSNGNVLEVSTDFGDINAFEVNVAASSRDGNVTKYQIVVGARQKYSLQKLQ